MTDLFSKLYSPLVLKHFSHPKNVGEIKNADGVATVGNPVCGDVMRFYIKVGSKNGIDYIKDAKFQTLGCGAAIATSSILTQLAKGKNFSQVTKLTSKNIAETLGGLPAAKVHCSVLAYRGLMKAISNYQKNNH